MRNVLPAEHRSSLVAPPLGPKPERARSEEVLEKLEGVLALLGFAFGNKKRRGKGHKTKNVPASPPPTFTAPLPEKPSRRLDADWTRSRTTEATTAATSPAHRSSRAAADGHCVMA